MDDGGLTVFKYNKNIPYIYKNYKYKDGLPGPKIRSIYYDNRDYIWITSEADGILVTTLNKVFTSSTLTGLYIDTKQDISSNEIKIITENEKYIFLGGKIRLTRIKKDEFYNRMIKLETLE